MGDVIPPEPEPKDEPWRTHWQCGCADEPWVPDGEACPACGYDPDNEPGPPWAALRGHG